MMNGEEEEMHPIFRQDPEEWMQYIYKQLSVLTDDGVEHVGLVYTVDPVSKSYVLINFSDDNTSRMEIILGHAISSVTVLSCNTEPYKQRLDRMFRPAGETTLSEEELQGRQSLLRSWLLKNRLPVDVTGGRDDMLTIAGTLVIQPPYRAEDCSCTNEIILGKVQGLIASMPADHDKWC